MKKKLLLLMLCLSVGMTTFSQSKTDIYGLLTTIDHPSDPTQGAILAIMTDSYYLPIFIREGEYVSAATPQMLCGKPIQIDSIYHFVRTETNGVFSYDFKQLYKGVEYVVKRGAFITEPMGVDPSTGIPLPGLFFYFLTESGEILKLTEFKPEQKSSGAALGGRGASLSYNGSKPDSVFTIRFAQVIRNNKDYYLATHLLSSEPTQLTSIESERLMITTTGEQVHIISPIPMSSISLQLHRDISTIPCQSSNGCDDPKTLNISCVHPAY